MVGTSETEGGQTPKASDEAPRGDQGGEAGTASTTTDEAMTGRRLSFDESSVFIRGVERRGAAGVRRGGA
jgi:hypothetical protein